MFIVFNREKINSYLISIGTVVLLFVMGFFITDNNSKEVSAIVNEEQNINNTIQNLKNEIIE